MAAPVVTFEGAVKGTAASGFDSVVSALLNAVDADPDYSFQLVAYRGADVIVDVHGGEGIGPDTLMVPFSVSKNAIGFSIALLVDRGLLDLDAPVARYWPAFSARGKGTVTVRQLLSHQAGLAQTIPPLTEEEIADAVRGGAKLAAQSPLWHPGAGFGYHGATIGVLASELVRSVTGQTLQEYYEENIRSPRGLDFYLGLPEHLEARRVDLLPMRPGESAEPRFSLEAGQLGRHVFTPAPAHDSDDDRRAYERWQRAVGIPAVYSTVSARGIAGLFAECAIGVTGPALIGAESLEAMAQAQVFGHDLVVGVERSFGVVFQKPTVNLAFGGFRAYGHDGAGGALGFHDPATGISFGYTVRRTPPPGGADTRALQIAQLLQATVLGSASGRN